MMNHWEGFWVALLVDSNQKILPLNSGSNVSSMTWFTIAMSRWVLYVNDVIVMEMKYSLT